MLAPHNLKSYIDISSICFFLTELALNEKLSRPIRFVYKSKHFGYGTG